MIKLENIQISFDRPLILDGTLEIHPGLITLLKGPSGSGKSSILDLVGLLKNNPHLHYTFNGQKLEYSDHLFAKYRQSEIGYVLQDYALLDHLSIFQNLSWYANMINHSLTRQEAYSLLEDVCLFLDLDTPITVLSGGERQRVAIACALLKHPSLLILDEPTSALDDDNAKMVMDTLEDLAKKGYMILLASHASFVEKYCDVIYEINNQHLNCIKDQHVDCFSQPHQKDQPLSIKFYFNYFFNFFKKNILIQSILIVIVGLSFSFFLLSDDFLDAFKQKETTMLNDIAGLEILVVSDKIDPNFIHYNPDLPPLKKEHLDAIGKIEHITNIQPFYEGVGGPHIKTDKGDFNLSFAIQPYYGNKFVASYQLDYHLNHARKLSFDFYLPNNPVVPFNELIIEEVLPIENNNHYSLSDDVLYMPYHLFPKATSIQALLVQVDHFKNMHLVKSNILNVDDTKNIACYHHPFNNTEMNSILASIESMIPLLKNIMIMLITILVFFVYTRHIGQRKKEIWLLKINGLSKKNTLLLVSIEMFMQALFISLFSLLSEKLLLLILKNTMNISLSISITYDLIINFLLSLTLLFVPMILSLLAYQRKDLATALRNG